MLTELQYQRQVQPQTLGKAHGQAVAALQRCLQGQQLLWAIPLARLHSSSHQGERYPPRQPTQNNQETKKVSLLTALF